MIHAHVFSRGKRGIRSTPDSLDAVQKLWVSYENGIRSPNKRARADDPLTSKDLFGENSILKRRVVWQSCAYKMPSAGICTNRIRAKLAIQTESTSEFKSWSVDAPGEFFVSVYQRWKKQTNRKKDIAEMMKFIESLCPQNAKLCRHQPS